MLLPPADVAGVVLRYLEDSNLSDSAACFRRDAKAVLQHRSATSPKCIYTTSLRQILSEYVQLSSGTAASRKFAQQLRPSILRLLEVVDEHAAPQQSQSADIVREAFSIDFAAAPQQPQNKDAFGMAGIGSVNNRGHFDAHDIQCGTPMFPDSIPLLSSCQLPERIGPPLQSRAPLLAAQVGASLDENYEWAAELRCSLPPGLPKQLQRQQPCHQYPSQRELPLQARGIHRNKSTPKKRRLQQTSHCGTSANIQQRTSNVLDAALDPVSLLSITEAGEMQDRFAEGLASHLQQRGYAMETQQQHHPDSPLATLLNAPDKSCQPDDSVSLLEDSVWDDLLASIPNDPALMGLLQPLVNPPLSQLAPSTLQPQHPSAVIPVATPTAGTPIDSSLPAREVTSEEASATDACSHRLAANDTCADTTSISRVPHEYLHPTHQERLIPDGATASTTHDNGKHAASGGTNASAHQSTRQLPMQEAHTAIGDDELEAFLQHLHQ